MKARNAGGSRKLLLGLIVLAAASFGYPSVAAPPQITGSLETVQGIRVLKVWGTPDQRGYAHGQLLGREIVGLFEGTVLHPDIIHDPRRYEPVIRGQFLGKMRFSPDQRAELEGMLRGITDAVGVDGLRLEQLGRNLDVRDLMAINCLVDWCRMSCSSFSAWGEATADGQTITARNLDFLALPDLEATPLVIAHLDPGSGRQRWATVAWPGLIGVFTAMNEQGATVSMHYGPGREPTHTGAFVPCSLALRDAIETAAAATAVQDVKRVLITEPSMFGYNIHVSSPFVGQPDPAAVLEYDGDLSKNGGVTLRTSDAAPLRNWIVCTNHYCRRGEPPQDPEDGSLVRYQTLEQALTTAGQEHRKIDLAFAWQTISQVACRGTLHSVVFLPQRKEMHVRVASPGSPAQHHQPVAFQLEQLLTR